MDKAEPKKMKKHPSNIHLILSLLCSFWTFYAKSDTPKKFTLANGLKVYLLKDNSLPYVQYDLIVPSGSSSDPAGQEGLASLTAKMLSRGTHSHTSFELTKKLENLGTQFSAQTYRDYSVFSADTLSWHHDTLLSLFSEIITRPSFPDSETAWMKNQTLSKIEKQPESPFHFANKIFAHKIFQNKHYAHNPEGFQKTVQKLTTKDILNYYKMYFAPQYSILGVTGQYPADIQKQLEKHFLVWKKTPLKLKPKKTSIFSFWTWFQKKEKQKKTSTNKPRFSIIHQKGVFQSEIRIGKPFISRTSPDYLPVKMANMVLGAGGLDSRLFNEVREKQGLTYRIQSQLFPLMEGGLVTILTSTRLEVTRKAVDKIVDVMKVFYEKGITEKELEKAKKSYRIQLLKSSEQATARLFRRIFLNYIGLPYDLNHLDKYLKRIKLKDVNRVIQKYYSTEDIQFIIFSDFEKIKSQFQDIQDLKVENFNQFL